jgi:hypothetical protein
MATDAGTPTRPKKKRIDLAAMYEAVQQSSDPAKFIQADRNSQQAPQDAFNPQAFLSNVLRTQSLKELLETDSSMIKGTVESYASRFFQSWPTLLFSCPFRPISMPLGCTLRFI